MATYYVELHRYVVVTVPVEADDPREAVRIAQQQPVAAEPKRGRADAVLWGDSDKDEGNAYQATVVGWCESCERALLEGTGPDGEFADNYATDPEGCCSICEACCERLEADYRASVDALNADGEVA